ncbi:hypothetical protein [Mycobacterium paraseoulense]|uniref:Uncharacterized protein n=1 Tax=Mycobacterium paraseoulense TaxID=590652 RepID=A0A1X0IFR3_9MYCO|nr:hypothetical protein [Mycobacterium paraseoulense]MCV7396133.1 hypothetical protein [Mycobacterium paraseoulense]ORB45787.1 hypothetical protein BST39_03425 [Mycobacterium paraseoulense]
MSVRDNRDPIPGQGDSLLKTLSTANALRNCFVAEDGEMFNISALCGGMPPEIAWCYLRRFAELG